jgi:acyl carrier protein
MTTVRGRLAELVSAVSDNLITAEEALAATGPLTALGLSSLAQMRLIDAVETEFGVRIDLAGDDIDVLDDLDALTALVTADR